VAGRSNVGKSTLINHLTQKTLARVSNAPGHTTTINFYELAPPAAKTRQLTLVDMPGYGFAHAKAEVVNQWAEMMRFYLEERASLRRLLVLLDVRHGIKQIDREFMLFLEDALPARVKFSCILTK
jgi:GTP-binding protein